MSVTELAIIRVEKRKAEEQLKQLLYEVDLLTNQRRTLNQELEGIDNGGTATVRVEKRKIEEQIKQLRHEVDLLTRQRQSLVKDLEESQTEKTALEESIRVLRNYYAELNVTVNKEENRQGSGKIRA